MSDQAPPMMQCGHAANAMSDGRPVCAICLIGVSDPRAATVAETPNLTQRQAVCTYSGPDGNEGAHRVGMQGRGYRVTVVPVPSSMSLPFFESKPNASFDRYYCGCFGWD